MFFTGTLASHQQGCHTSQVQLHTVVAVSRAATGMEALVAGMIVIVTKTKMKINLEKKSSRNLFQNLIKEPLLKGRLHAMAGLAIFSVDSTSLPFV